MTKLIVRTFLIILALYILLSWSYALGQLDGSIEIYHECPRT